MILTSDLDDIKQLVRASGREVTVVAIGEAVKKALEDPHSPSARCAPKTGTWG
jgi:hypothetical protein